MNSLTSTVDLFDSISIIARWPNEILQVNLSDYTHAAGVTAKTNFYRPDFFHTNVGENTFTYTYLNVTTILTAGEILTLSAANTYPDVLGSAIKWDVGNDIERGGLTVEYLHPDSGYANAYYAWHSSVFPSRVVPIVLSGTSYSIQISSVLADPLINNTQTNSLPHVYAPAASAMGVTSQAANVDLQFPISRYSQLIESRSPLTTSTFISYLSGDRTVTTQFIATNSTGITQSTWTSALSAPVVSGSLYGIVNFVTVSAQKTWTIFDYATAGVFKWFENGVHRSGVSAGGSGTVDYNTGLITINFTPPLYFTTTAQSVITYDYKPSSLNGYVLATSLSAINHKNSGENMMSQYYNASGADYITLSSSNVPIYLFDIATDLSNNGVTSMAPSANGYVISFTPTATAVNISANVVHISGAFLSNWSTDVLWNLVPGWHQVGYAIDDVLPSGVVSLTGSNLAYNISAGSMIEGTTYLILSANPADVRTQGTVNVSVSSADGSMTQTFSIPWIINPDNWAIRPVIDSNDNDSALLHVEVDNLTIVDDQQIAWIVSPNENIVVVSTVNGLPIALSTACYWTTASEVSVSNLGVSLTEISVSSISPSNAGSVFWSPSSWNNVTLDLRAGIDTFNNRAYTRTLPLSATLKKRGMLYSMPSTLQLTWNIQHDPAVTSYGTTAVDAAFEFNQPVNGAEFDVITANFIAPTVSAYPSTYQATIYASVESSYLNISSSPVPTYTVTFDDFPSVNLLTVAVSSNFNSVTSELAEFNATRTHDIFVPVSATNLYFEDTSIIHTQPGRYANLTRVWQLSSDQGVVTYPVTGSILDITLTPTGSSISAVLLTVDYYSDTWRMLHTQSLPIYIHFLDIIPTMSAVAFPSLAWEATQSTPRALTFSNFSASSLGLTAYGNCHSETISISAAGSYDAYHFAFGDSLVTSNTPTATGVLTCPGISDSFSLGVTAFNSVITPDTPSTYYDISGNNHVLTNRTNTPSASGGNLLWHDVYFFDYLSPSVSISSIDAPSFSLGNYDRPILNLTVDLQTIPHLLRLQSPATVTFDVGGSAPYSFSYTATMLPGSNTIQAQFQTRDPNDIHYLNDNEATPITITVSGNCVQYVDYEPYDYCPSTTNFGTTSLYITACPSPIIELFNSVAVGCINTPFVIVNSTAQTISTVAYDQFIIDNGDRTTQTIDASSSTIEITYQNTGTYYISVSGVQDGQVISEQTFGPLIVYSSCDELIEQYRSNTTRKLGEALVLPYSCSTLSIQNEWVTKDTFNSMVQKISSNLQYIIDNCTMYDPVLPFAYIGWFGAWTKSRFGKWNVNTDSKFAYDQSVTTDLSNVRSIVWDANYNVVHIVQNTGITMHAYDKTMTQISPGIQQSLSDFQAATLIDNKLYVIDRYTNGVYAYDTIPYSASPYVLAQYFAQFGDANTKQGLNKPTDITNDGEQVYIVDQNNYTVKVYNRALAWTSQFTHSDWQNDVKPVSIAVSDEFVFVLASNKTVYKFSIVGYVYDSKWVTPYAAQRIRTYSKQQGFVAILTLDSVVKVTHDGVHVGIFSQPVGQNVRDMCYNDNHTAIIAANDKLFAVIDIVAAKTIRTDVVDNILWSQAELLTQSNEFVSAWVHNSVLKKLWDNIMIVDHSVHSKFVQYMTPQTTDINFAIVTTTSGDRPEYDDSQLLIGNNEMVTSHVIERCFNCLCTAIDQLKSKVETSRRFDPCVSQLCWTWQALRGTHTPFSANCVSNPLTWFELQTGMPTSFSKRWCDAIGCGCDASTIPNDGLILDDAITYLRVGGSILLLR